MNRYTIGDAITVLAVALAAGSLACAPSAYRRSVDDWHAGRVERLTRDDGYLSLVGLFPLEEGSHSFGSHQDNDFVFPRAAPSLAGTIRVDGGRVTVTAAKSVAILHSGEPVTTVELEPDTARAPTRLDMGTFTFYAIERGGKLYLRLKDHAAPAFERFRGVDRFPVDEKWRVLARFERYSPPKTIRVPNVLGYDYVGTCEGALVFELDGAAHRLEPMSTAGPEWFVVFGDQTSGAETYGGGRFVYVPAPDSSGTTWIDFNKAYNPPCAFTPFATCPLPHRDNVLDTAIRAGEKDYDDPAHIH